ncbi:hypothetical protein fugu_003456 [Takifugu bimaculatus]|uniref:Stereocilin LRR domain-containing protein n=1 Tax=Takifugu bimaculatus TaxID=433685 RepID=A0A4Z2BHF6_9TELE|nr:hypothetical protein fugu_003456 [Takifugu bimaculatus]
MKMAKKGPGMATLTFTGIMVCIVLLRSGSSEKTGGKEAQRDALFKEIIAKLTTEIGRSHQRAPPPANADQPVHPWVRNIVGSLKTFGLLPSKNLPSLSKRIDRHRLSGFLYNISLYLQEMGAELEEAPSEPEENQLWEKLLHFILQSEGLNQWGSRLPPRPSVKVQDLFLSLRGSPHWDWFLGLLQGLISLSERQPHRSILTYLSENWRTVSAVLEVVLQALISGTYGQASAGLQGFICALKGGGERSGHLAQKNLALVQSLDELRKGLLHRVGSSVYDSLKKKASRVTMVLLDDISSLVEVPQPRTQGRCSVGELTCVLQCPRTRRGIRHNVTWNAQALAVTSQGLANSFPFLTCPSSGSGPEKIQESSSHQKELEYTSIEILEAACNESIPGLTGVSNFTVFLYCKLFEGENGSIDPAAAQMGLDLHTTCSDAAWYLSAAEEDFLWVHVCSEFFAHEFNNTVCSNSSFWLQRANQAILTKDYHLFNQTSIDDLCTQQPRETVESPRLDKNCLADLGNGLFNAQTFRHCFLPNSSVLISALCGRDSPDSHHSAPEDSWAAAYCYKVKNTSLVSAAEEACQYRKWGEHHFTNATLLERCGQTHGLREHVCFNATLYSQLLDTHPDAAAFCADLEAELEDKNCFLRRFFDMLPAPYEFDTSQLCVDPAPLLVEAVHKLSVCGLEGGEREGFLVVLGYVLRVLDFMVGLSSGLDEGENEARQGLGQAILLSSLVDNTSWTKVEPEASTSILQTEYLRMPGDSIRTLASQKEVQAMETMTAAFIHKFPRVTPELFVDLSQFIPFMSVSDIMSFPASLIVNDSVLTAIRDHSSGMKLLQKKAFVKRLLQSSAVGDVPTWPPYFLTSILPLLPHLPVSHFQQLTSQQLTPLVGFLGNTSLDGVRGRHVIRTLFNSPNLTRDNILRMGILACYLEPQDLGSYLQDAALSAALLPQLARCTSEGFISENGRLHSWLAPTVENFSTMEPLHLSALSRLLPQLGAPFLLSLPSQLLLELLSQPGIRRYSPAQAFQILSKISKETNLTVEKLCKLMPLHSGLSPDVIADLHWSGISEDALCQCWRTLITDLKPSQRSWLFDATQEVLHRNLQNITQEVKCLLPFVPLKTLTEILDGETMLGKIRLIGNILWSPQQAQLLFRMIHKSENITSRTVRDLGHIAGGMSCEFLNLRSNETDFAALLQFVTELPGSRRPALRKCIIDELKKHSEIDLSLLSPGFAATLPVTMLEDLSNSSFSAILDHIQTHLTDFLKLPHYKQTNLAEKVITRLGSSQAEGQIDGPALDALGPLLPFLDQGSLALVDRGALALRLEEMRSFCLPKEALRGITSLLTHKDLLGEPSKWQVGDVEHLGRLVLSLSTKHIDSIPLMVLNKDTVELVLLGQRQWEDGGVGKACVNQCVDQQLLRQQTQSLLRGIVNAPSRRARAPVPSCADIRGTFPSAWTSAQLSRMSQDDLKQCVEVFAQDASLSAEQRRALWVKLRQVIRMSFCSCGYSRTFGPVRQLRADQLLSLGSLVTEMSERELHDISSTNPAVLAHLGTLTDWSLRKMRAVISAVLRKRKLKVEQLTAVDLATFGRLICGLYPSEIRRLSAHNLSMAVPFLRETSLPCTEHQMEAITSCLFRPEAFGPVSTWGPEAFTEIGTLAGGLEDLVLSALVQEQLEGIVPEALALMTPKKMAVVFSALQLSWFSVEQAWAVTEEQWAELDAEQKLAVQRARYEGDVLLELRGRNSAAALLIAECFPVHSLAVCLCLWHMV